MHWTRARAALGFAFWVGGTAPASAIPTLQIYIDGAAYDPVGESWVTGSGSFDLWVLATRPLRDVKLAVAFTTGETGSVTLTPSTAGDFDGVPGDDDLSLPAGGVQTQTEASASVDGARPALGDGSLLPAHGVYGVGVSFLEFVLGDFSLRDSPIGDYEGTPTSHPAVGQIDVYTVSVQGFLSGLHFDVYADVVSGRTDGELRSVSAPFSHDAEVPEASVLVLLGAGLAASRLRGR